MPQRLEEILEFLENQMNKSLDHPSMEGILRYIHGEREYFHVWYRW